MLLIVGHIGKPHGIRGELLVTVRTDEPEARFVAGSVFTTQVPRDRRVGTGPARGGPIGAPGAGVAAAGPLLTRRSRGTSVVNTEPAVKRSSGSSVRTATETSPRTPCGLPIWPTTSSTQTPLQYGEAV